MPDQPDKVNAFPLVGPTYAVRNPLFTGERSYNWYVSVDESNRAVSKMELSPVPGLATFGQTTDPPVRGLWVGDNRLFAVGGSRLHEVFGDGTISERGFLGSGDTPVQFAASGQEMLIVDSDQIFRDDGATHPPGTNLPNVFQPGISVVFLDQYFVALEDSTNRIRWSFGNGGVTWDAADFIDVHGTPEDRAVRLEVHEGHIWVFCRHTIVPYYNAGDPNTPFQPIQGAVMNVGTMAPWSVTKIDGTLYWLGQDYNGYGRVYRSQGYTPVRISNMAIEYLIAGYLRLGTDELITGSGYTENGHTFYVLSFPLAKACLVYDLTTDMWHERARWNAGTGQWDHWRGASFHAHVFRRHYVARTASSPFSGTGEEKKIYEQSVDIYTDDGLPIRRFRRAPYLVAGPQQWLNHHYLKLFTNGTTAIDMRYQLDDGVNWSNTRTVAPSKHEVKYRRLGRARDRLYEVSVLETSGTDSTAIMDAYVHATPGLTR